MCSTAGVALFGGAGLVVLVGGIGWHRLALVGGMARTGNNQSVLVIANTTQGYLS